MPGASQTCAFTLISSARILFATLLDRDLNCVDHHQLRPQSSLSCVGGVVVVQTLESARVSVQARTHRATNSSGSMGVASATKWLKASHHLNLRQHVPGRVTHAYQLTPKRGKKGLVAHPPHPSVEQILEGSTFSIAYALDVPSLCP